MGSLVPHGFALASALAVAACAAPAVSDGQDGQEEAASEAAWTAGSSAPADPNATAATRTVLANLRSFDMGSSDVFDRRVLIGQQEADVSNRSTSGLVRVPSDLEAVTRKAPALVSYELSHAYPRSTTMFDPAGLRAGRGALRELVLDKHAKGALVSFLWHMRCPKASANDRDLFAPEDCPRDYRLEELLERKRDGSRGAHFAEWRALLDELAELLWSLKDQHGELVPVQIRPFHEHTGAWFWWGRTNPASIYAAVWREMVTYLREGRGLHNVLWVYCPGAPTDRNLLAAGGSFEAYYPGDAYVDVVAFDRYDRGDGTFASGYEADLAKIGAFARAHGKVAAVGEVGLQGIGPDGSTRDPSWFTRAMLAPLKARGRSFAYVGLWRNAPWEKFIPEPRDGALADDLRRMADDPAALFAGRHDLYVPLHAF
jgi:mannan endo-1,4-beta-mannosidase